MMSVVRDDGVDAIKSMDHISVTHFSPDYNLKSVSTVQEHNLQ